MKITMVVIVALLQITFSRMSYLGQPVSTAQLNCLQKAGYLEQTFIQAEYSYTSDFLRLSADPQLVLDTTKTKPFLVLRIEEYKYQNSPDLQALMYASALKKYPIKMIWVAIFIKNTSCSYFVSFLMSLQRHLQITIGIAGFDGMWEYSFGDRNACTDLSSLYLFWYYETSDFSPYGGWASCDLTARHDSEERKCETYVFEITTCNQKELQF